MPIDSTTGVYYELHGKGTPLMVTLPLMASHREIFGDDQGYLVDGYLDLLTDRYQVILVDYPSIGRSRDIPPSELTPQRVTSDLLGVATAAGIDRFVYWGYSWSGGVGLQLASRSDRLIALVVGGWPPLGGPYAELLAAARLKLPAPEPSSMKILRSKGQYAQWITYNEALIASWNEQEAVRSIQCPRMIFFGSDGDLVEAGIPVAIASLIRGHRAELEASGWFVLEIPGHGHAVTMHPELVVPPVRRFLDAVV